MTTTHPIWHLRPPSPQRPETPKISFFRSPITNTHPHSIATLRQIYNAIRGDFYKPQTEKLREILKSNQEDRLKKARQYKALNFDYCTFSGVFTTRNDKALVKHSKLICFDFDNINVSQLRYKLMQDEYFDTQLLFVSPSGNGLKWIIAMDNWATNNHAKYFTAVADYIQETYNVAPDKSGKDLSRACFLPHDPNPYINTLYLKN